MGNNGTVLVLDNDSKVVESLERLLRFNGYSVRTFTSPELIFEYRVPEETCCALVDVRMPGFNGFEIQAWLTRANPGLPVILMTGHGDIAQAVAAMRTGAADFLTKPIEESRLMNAVKRALTQGQRFRTEEEARAIYEKRYQKLTPREKQVCALVTKGMLNKQIAGDLGICEKTVKVHRGRVMKTLKVESVAELVKVVLSLRGRSVASLREARPLATSAVHQRVTMTSGRVAEVDELLGRTSPPANGDAPELPSSKSL
jgi:FixJ family two-component response regulator